MAAFDPIRRGLVACSMRWKYGEQRGSCRVRPHKTTLYGVNNVFDEEAETEILPHEQTKKRWCSSIQAIRLAASVEGQM
jgi:hypothetical protein